MKKIFTLFLASNAFFFNGVQAQVVLNEMYGSPGSTTHEFFELFNSGTESTPTSVDGFTVITYFEEGSSKGFYVLDLPAMFIQPHGYFVGSAALPFNYQGTTNSTASNFSWNDPLLTSKSAYLRKWVLTGTDNSDGNVAYNEGTIPANFNDLFNKRTGGSMNYSMFIYKNGLLVNTFYGGAGGSTTQPSFITSMPDLNVSSVIGGVVNSTFTVKFSQFTNNAAEYVNSEAGTDNGFIRKKDGVCNTWDKSSNSVNHTPGLTNGPSSGSGSITLTGSITRGTAPATTSTVTYDITAASTSAFPVELQVYVDNGTVAGDLDGGDTYLESKTQNAVSDPAYTTTFSPLSANIIIVAKTAAGCFGQVKLLTDGTNSTLPVKLISFNGNAKGDMVNLTWTVDLNETVDRFEIEKSYNGTSFQKTGTVNGYSASGLQVYNFSDAHASKEKVSYRLKMFDKDQKAEYSRIISFFSSSAGDVSISLMQNPVVDKLNISFTTKEREIVDVRIVDMTGALRSMQKVSVQSGSNILYVSLPSTLLTGFYIVSVSHSKGMYNQKFVRQ